MFFEKALNFMCFPHTTMICLDPVPPTLCGVAINEVLGEPFLHAVIAREGRGTLVHQHTRRGKKPRRSAGLENQISGCFVGHQVAG